jgi:hypothetical protein
MQSKQYVIELDGVTYRCSGDKLEQIVDLKDLQEDTWFISDLQAAIGRTMTVEAPVKYAEVMVRKKLQESGEFDEPVSIIVHWKKKKEQNTTDIFFTAIPSRLFHGYLQQTKEHEDSVLLFPLFSVLHGVLKRMRHPEPVAVVFQHSRFADLVIGTRKRILYANRCVAFDTSEEQVSALWDMVKTDITTVEEENRIKVGRILLINWIDSGPGPEWTGDTQREFSSMEEDTLSYSGQDYLVSFIKAMRMQSCLGALSPPLEKISYYSRRFLPYLSIIFFLATLLCVGGYFWYTQKAGMLDGELTTLQGKIGRMQHEALVEESPYNETFSFVRDLARYYKSPSYKSVVNDISEALPEGMTVEVLKVDYTESRVTIEIFGKTESPFDDAYEGYQRFTDMLVQWGYRVVESKFDTEIRQSQFMTRFTRTIQ